MRNIIEKSKVKLWGVLAVVVVVALVVGVAAGTWFSTGQAAKVQQVERVFLDVNGDGRVDLLVEGDVIFNLPLPPTPTPGP